VVAEPVKASKSPQDFSPQRDVSTGSTSAFHSQDSLVAEPVVADLVEASKPP